MSDRAENVPNCPRCGNPLAAVGALNPRGAIGGQSSYMHPMCAAAETVDIRHENEERKRTLNDAAPDLLAALMKLSRARNGYCFCGRNDGDAEPHEHAPSCIQARSAIAKANK